MWSFSADAQNQTNVSVQVIEKVAPGIEKKTPYSLSLDQRYEVMSEELMSAVAAKLDAAGLL